MFFRNNTLQRAEIFWHWIQCIKIPMISKGFTFAGKVNQGRKRKQFWNQQGKPHTMSHGRDGPERNSGFGNRPNVLHTSDKIIIARWHMFVDLSNFAGLWSTGIICGKGEEVAWWMESHVRFPRVLDVLPREKIEGPSMDFLKGNPRPDQRPKTREAAGPRFFSLWSGQGLAFRKSQRGPSIFFWVL